MPSLSEDRQRLLLARSQSFLVVPELRPAIHAVLLALPSLPDDTLSMLESPAVYKVCTDCSVTPSRWLAATLLTLARSYHQYLPMKLRTQVWHHNVGYFKRVMRPYLTLFETQRAGPSIDVSFATRRHSPAARYDGNLARTCGDLISPLTILPCLAPPGEPRPSC